MPSRGIPLATDTLPERFLRLCLGMTEMERVSEMQYYHIQFESEVLKSDAEFGVFLPDRAQAQYKVLWLLHGAFSEYGDSVIQSSITRYAEARGMAVVAPSSYLGVYTDMAYGEAGYSYVKEVVEKAPKLFTKLSARREDNYLMGISMGGHGSFKLAMELPERFYGAAAFSSPIDMVYTMTLLENGQHGGGHELFDAFESSEACRGTVRDVVFLAEKNLAEGKALPRLSLCWGDDEMAGHEDSRIERIFREKGIPLFTKIAPGGHNFFTWDPLVPEVLSYLMEGAEAGGSSEGPGPEMQVSSEVPRALESAAVLHFRGGFPSPGVAARFTLVLPSLLPEQGKKFPLLLLPMDEGKSADDLLYRCDIRKIAENFGIAVVMPEGLHSDYEDMVRGMNWYRYISEALPQYLFENFPLSEKAEDRLVFGFGMGGLGAIRFGLRKPDFAAAFGACDTDLTPFSEDEGHETPEYAHRMQTIYGDDWRSEQVLTKSDPALMAERCEKLPDFFLYSHREKRFEASMRSFCKACGGKPVFRAIDGNARAEEVLRLFLNNRTDRDRGTETDGF